MNIDTEVLVVGGDLMGLALASDLAVRKRSTILLE
jgi:2-polyprenyl-6-methoxyphenol hydroxylase-like FAD-dependent oxidoreductase